MVIVTDRVSELVGTGDFGRSKIIVQKLKNFFPESEIFRNGVKTFHGPVLDGTTGLFHHWPHIRKLFTRKYIHISIRNQKQHPKYLSSRGQYKYTVVKSSKHTLKCNANLPSNRYIIAQQPVNGAGLLTICEMEVFAAKNLNSKIWKRYQSTHLTGYTTRVTTFNNVMSCLLMCVPGEYDSVNFHINGAVCEMNSHMNGYQQTSLNNLLGWIFLEVEYA
ncbi:hypothetical protein HELRODRAFT_171258 [Helobdella robusta]|uniref:Apple domain-containing protein n=1 Tax=Helobdella robusta TaxID=6412 RepID=T1F400_HELRO|nr:hypothetical protein HELRODRAFT_171258 [Helobdella robusta]ESO05605.1 hypothetical protein HELRODRAFT_171258 [Helobdella robusta]